MQQPKSQGPIQSSKRAIQEDTGAGGIGRPAVHPAFRGTVSPTAHGTIQTMTTGDNVPSPAPHAPVVQRAINILPGPHQHEPSRRWTAEKAYELMLPNVGPGINLHALKAVLMNMDAANWMGTSIQAFLAEVHYQYQQLVPQQQDEEEEEEEEEDDQQDNMPQEEEEEEESSGSDDDQPQAPVDFYNEDELIDEEEDEEEEDQAQAEPFPNGIDGSAVLIEYNPAQGRYGATYVTGFTSSYGDPEGSDLEGIHIKEEIIIGRNDFLPPAAIETAYTTVSGEGMISDMIGTSAQRIHDSVPHIAQFPAVYETPQTLSWRYPHEGADVWHHLANIPITVTVADRSAPGAEFRQLFVITNYNNKPLVQPYIGPPVRK